MVKSWLLTLFVFSSFIHLTVIKSVTKSQLLAITHPVSYISYWKPYWNSIIWAQSSHCIYSIPPMLLAANGAYELWKF